MDWWNFLLFLLIFASAVAPEVNKDQILFNAFPAPGCHRAEVGNALQLPLLYSFLPLHFFYSLPGISGRGSGLLTAPGFSCAVGNVSQALVWLPGEGSALQEMLGASQLHVFGALCRDGDPTTALGSLFQ